MVAGLRGPRPRPRRPHTLASICLFRSGGPRPVSCPCRSWGASWVPTSPPRWKSYGAGRAFSEGGVMSVLCRVCQVFPPLVSTFGLFPILVKCDYQFILIQLCLSHYLWLSCVFIVLSIQYDFVWSTRYSPVFLLVSALPCHALPCFSTLNTIILSYIVISMFLVHPSCVHCDSFE